MKVSYKFSFVMWEVSKMDFLFVFYTEAEEDNWGGAERKDFYPVEFNYKLPFSCVFD